MTHAIRRICRSGSLVTRNQSERKTGTVRAWFPARGFGFIAVDASSESLFFHKSRMKRPFEVRLGDRVSFGKTFDRDGRLIADGVSLEEQL